MIEVVGLGAAGWSSLGKSERALVRSAQVLLGGQRHLDLIPLAPDQPGPDQVRLPWPSPLRPGLVSLLEQHRGRSIVALASGDPLLAGIGSTLIELLGPEQVRIHPHLSSVTLARSRMGWSAESVSVIRIQAGVDQLRRDLAPGQRLVILSADGSTPAACAALLSEQGWGDSLLTVWSDLGSPEETSVRETAASWTRDQVSPLNVICLECLPDQGTAALSRSPGLPDDSFDHDGQLTKREVRAAALARLGPLPGELLWDVGAGSGSIAIEWSRAANGTRAIAIERSVDRARRIAANAVALGVVDLRVVEGSAPDALSDLPVPDAIFVGGGATSETLTACWDALADGGSLVVHAVTMETESLLVKRFQTIGGELTRISVETMEPLGSLSGWKPARAVVQWSVRKSVGPSTSSGNGGASSGNGER